MTVKQNANSIYAPDGSLYITLTDGAGNLVNITDPAADVTVDTSVITGGTSGRILYNNADTVGEKTTTGTGSVVLASSPTLVTPTLGAATATSINGNTITTGTGTLTLGAGKTLTSSNTLTLTATDGSTLAVGTGGTLGTNAYTSTAYAPLNSPTLVTPTLGAATATSLTFSPTTGGIVGTTTNNNADAGKVGEYISSNIASGSVSLTTNVAANITSISLTAGDWDVTGSVNFLPAATTSVTRLLGSISSISATLDLTNDAHTTLYMNATVSGGVASTLTLPTKRVSLSGTTTIYLVSFATFTVSTITGGGVITARRVR